MGPRDHVLGLIVGALLAMALMPAALSGVTARVSVDSHGVQGNGASWGASLSRDGRYAAFSSTATNLVVGDTNGRNDVFVHDLVTGETTRVSVSSSGAQGNDHSSGGVISGDGRLVVFFSNASNLAPGDTNRTRDLFAHDRVTHETTRVSVSSQGMEGDCDSMIWFYSVSRDGQFVVFDSCASNLVPGDTNDKVDVFLRDRERGETTRVSVATSGAQGDENAACGGVSDDGTTVTFSSGATNLVTGDTNGHWDAFVRDLRTGETSLASITPDGRQGDGDVVWLTLSIDGRLVVFESEATNLVPGDRNGARDVFLKDRQNGTITLISTDEDGTQFADMSTSGVLSAEGRFVGFSAMRPALVFHAYVHEVDTGLTRMVSVVPNGAPSIGALASVIAGGGLCGFSSEANDLVPGDTNGVSDSFVYRPATLALDGTPSAGNPVRWRVTGGEVGDLALVLLSGSGRDGFVLGGHRLPLTFDGFTAAGLLAYIHLSAIVDGTGTATTPTLIFPDIPPGLVFFADAITIDPGGWIASVTWPISFTSG